MNIKQAILLAGGNGTRLYPLTKCYQKNLVPINGKFVIDYTLDTLLKLGVKELIIVLGGSHYEQIVSYLKDGSEFGFSSIAYVYQNRPEGISHAINLCKNLISDDKFFVLLGDNIYDSEITFNDFDQYGAQIVLKEHNELDRFGVMSLTKNGKIEKIQEKPKVIDYINYDNYAITGLYMFDYKFFEFFKRSKKSDRGEYEITSIIEQYYNDNDLGYSIYNGLWCDAGTHSSIKYLSDYFSNKENK